MAISLPILPIAILTSAVFIAGASLIPSPTIQTLWCFPCNSSMILTFSPGKSSACISETPDFFPIYVAASLLSPVSNTVVISKLEIADIIFITSFRIVSDNVMIPIICSLSAIMTDTFPSLRYTLMAC